MKKLVSVSVILLASALALYPLALGGLETSLITLGVLAVLCFLLALFTVEWILSGPGLILLLAEYTIALIERRGTLDAMAVGYAVGAFLLMELTDVALTLLRSERVAPEVAGVRVRQLLVVAVVGTIASAAVLLSGGLALEREPLLLFGGAAAGAGAVVLAVALANDVLRSRRT
jgi:hypothetical protein